MAVYEVADIDRDGASARLQNLPGVGRLARHAVRSNNLAHGSQEAMWKEVLCGRGNERYHMHVIGTLANAFAVLTHDRALDPVMARDRVGIRTWTRFS
jgi:hypothetical protein